MRALVAAALVAAIPASAEGPAFRVGVATVTLEELLRVCAEPAPQKQKWPADT